MENKKKTRNKPTHFGATVTFRIQEEKFLRFKELCEIKNKKGYNEVLRDLIDLYLRQNS